jgi:ATP-dependent Clp endopeptidase proteolytic subunit ClpP
MKGQIVIPVHPRLKAFANTRQPPAIQIPGRLSFARSRDPRAAAEFDLLIFGDIGESWWGESVTAANVAKQISEAGAKSILVRINSYGGSVTDGAAIYNALRQSGAKITTRVEGVAASIASLIAMAGDTLQMSSNTLLMIHAPWTGLMGNAVELREAADFLDTVARSMATSYARKSGKKLEDELVALSDGKDHWFTAEEAQASGYVDELLDAEQTDEADASARDQIVMAAMSRYRTAPVALSASYHRRVAALMTRSAAPAAQPPAPPRADLPQESRMNWKSIALALGIKAPEGATDAAVRDLIARHFSLATDCTDDEIGARLVQTNHGAQPPPAPGTQPTRESQIEALFTVAARGRPNDAALTDMRTAALLDTTQTVDQVRQTLLAHVTAGATTSSPIAGRYQATEAGADARDKRRVAAVSWLMMRGAVYKSGSQEAKTLASGMQGNPYYGMSLVDLARACLEDAGINTRGLNRHQLISAAITQSTSDLPNIFENALHKTLLAGFKVAPTTWDKVCKIGTLTDFRPHLRYRGASLGDLDVVQPNGEFKTISFNDAERESLQAKSRGAILNVSREMMINDDMGIFSDVALEAGKSANRTREKALYFLLALNAGLGPVMGDGKTLFHADHKNISANPGVPSVVRIDSDSEQMSQQMDPSGNDFVDIIPSIWLGPRTLRGTVLVINNDQYDPDANNKLQRTNIAKATYSEVIGTPRLTGAPWYSFADPNVEPVIEMGFLDGQQEPQLATEEAFNQFGMKWRIVDEWGMGAVGWRGGMKNPGA